MNKSLINYPKSIKESNKLNHYGFVDDTKDLIVNVISTVITYKVSIE